MVSLVSGETEHVCKCSLTLGKWFGIVWRLFCWSWFFLLRLLSHRHFSLLDFFLVWDFDWFFYLFATDRIVVDETVQESKNSRIGWNAFKEVFGIDTIFSLSDFFEFFQKILSKIFGRPSHCCNRLGFWGKWLILFHDGSDSVKWKEELIFNVKFLLSVWIFHEFGGDIQVIPGNKLMITFIFVFGIILRTIFFREVQGSSTSRPNEPC